MTELKPYVVEIEEVFRRRVIVWAENTGDAASRVEELCDSGDIDMDRNCFGGRMAVTSGIADDDDLDNLDRYI